MKEAGPRVVRPWSPLDPPMQMVRSSDTKSHMIGVSDFKAARLVYSSFRNLYKVAKTVGNLGIKGF